MNEKKYKIFAIIISIVLPIAVAALFSVKIEGYDFGILPTIYATINGITALVLLSAYFAIKNKKRGSESQMVYMQKNISPIEIYRQEVLETQCKCHKLHRWPKNRVVPICL